MFLFKFFIILTTHLHFTFVNQCTSSNALIIAHTTIIFVITYFLSSQLRDRCKSTIMTKEAVLTVIDIIEALIRGGRRHNNEGTCKGRRRPFPIADAFASSPSLFLN